MNTNGTPENLRPPWKKGEGSPNPGGRPRKTPFSDAYGEVADLSVAELEIRDTDSVAVAIAKATSKKALEGKTSAAVEAANRAEGKPRPIPDVPLAAAGPTVIHVEYEDGSNPFLEYPNARPKPKEGNK